MRINRINSTGKRRTTLCFSFFQFNEIAVKLKHCKVEQVKNSVSTVIEK